MKIYLILLILISVVSSADYVGNINDVFTAYLQEQGIVLGENDTVSMDSVVCSFPATIYENGSMYQNCQGGAICSICGYRYGEIVWHNGKPVCFACWKK